MEKQTFGNKIAALRREKGMTQLELAEKMGVTDKAVSKWERDLSFPDVGALPRLAGLFGVSVDDLMQGRTQEAENTAGKKIQKLFPLIFKAVALAMGVATATLSFLNRIDPNSAAGMLGIGLACLAITQFPEKDG
ncbi:MAG: helix-turn-helix transcriptional regulator [Oscillospiraceae bacterium]|nr:helix-turn-helix transcriptional regulator [Oscillospiraceae bacterium]